MGQPRHQVDHRNHHDQHQRDDVGEFAVVTPGDTRRRDTGRDPADRNPARKDHRRAFVDAQAPRNPEGEEPNHGNHQAGLQQSEDAGFHHVAEEDRRPEAHHTDLDKEFALDRRFHPRRDPPHVPDQQAEEHREKDRFETVVRDGREFGHHLRQQRQREDHHQRRQHPPQGAAQQQAPDIEHHQDNPKQVGDVVPRHFADQRRRHGGQVRGDQRRKRQQRDRNPHHNPILGSEFFKPVFHLLFIGCMKYGPLAKPPALQGPKAPGHRANDRRGSGKHRRRAGFQKAEITNGPRLKPAVSVGKCHFPRHKIRNFNAARQYAKIPIFHASGRRFQQQTPVGCRQG